MTGKGAPVEASTPSKSKVAAVRPFYRTKRFATVALLGIALPLLLFRNGSETVAGNTLSLRQHGQRHGGGGTQSGSGTCASCGSGGLALAGGPPPFSTRLVPLSDYAKKNLRFFVRTFFDTSGGPHCLAQTAWTAKNVVGVVNTFVDTAVDRSWAVYTADLAVAGPSEPGDISLVHEFHDRGHDGNNGVKQFVWELGDEPIQGMHRSSKHLGHTFYTRDFLRMPHRSIIRPYVNPPQWKRVPAGPEELRSVKEDIVIVDDNLGPIPQWLRRLSDRYPNLDVVVLEGFNKEQLVDLFRRAKVYVDASMRGAERAGQECQQYYVIPILENGRNGGNEFDYPLPESLKFAYARNEGGGVQNEGNDLVAKVDAVLGDWWGSVQRMLPARQVVASHPQLNAVDLARLFQITLAVHVLGCGAGKEGAGTDRTAIAQSTYLIASALHFIAPAASATLHSGSHMLEAEAILLVIAGRDTSGTLSFTHNVQNSAVCTGADGVGAALAASKFGNSDVAAVLSWRALPLRPPAIAAWQEAVRAGSADVSLLVINGVTLGAMYKLPEGGAPVPFKVALDEDGVLSVSGAGTTGSWPPATAPGQWVDLRTLGETKVVWLPGVETDEAVVDQISALTDAGIDVGDPNVGTLGHGAALAHYRQERSAAAYLCGHVDFRRIAGQTPYLHDLCLGAVAAP